MLRGEGEEWRSRNEWGKHRGPKARNDEVFEGSSRYRSVLTRDRSLSISHSLALPLAHPPHAPSPSTYPQPPIQSNPILLSPIYYFDPHLNLLSRFWIRFGTALIQCCVRSFASLLACLAPPRPYLAPHRRCFARLLPNSAMPPPLRRQRQAPLPAARRTGASECSDSHASTRRTSSSSSTPHRPRPPIWPHNSFATMASGARSRSNSRYRRLYSLFSSIILLRVLSCFPSNFYRVPVIEHATRCLDLHHDRDDYDGNHQTMTLTYSYIRMVAQVEFEKNKELSATIKQLQSQTQKLKKDAKVDEVKQAGSAVVEKTKAGVCRSFNHSINRDSIERARSRAEIDRNAFVCVSLSCSWRRSAP